MKIRFTKLNVLVVLLVSTSPLLAQSIPQLGKSPVSDVVKVMTLEEKVTLLVGQGMYVPGMPMPGMNATPTEAQKRVTGAAGSTYAIPRLGIPSLVVCDGPAGAVLLKLTLRLSLY